MEKRRRDKLQFEVACASTAEADVERLMVLVASLEKNLAEVGEEGMPTTLYTLYAYMRDFFIGSNAPGCCFFCSLFFRLQNRALLYAPLRCPLFGERALCVDQCLSCVSSHRVRYTNYCCAASRFVFSFLGLLLLPLIVAPRTRASQKEKRAVLFLFFSLEGSNRYGGGAHLGVYGGYRDVAVYVARDPNSVSDPVGCATLFTVACLYGFVHPPRSRGEIFLPFQRHPCSHFPSLDGAAGTRRQKIRGAGGRS